MPADIEQLKTLAEACPQGDPLRLMVSNGAWYIRNTAGIVLDVHRNRSFPQYLAENEAYANFIVAASPAVVLDLLARIDGLVAQHGRDSAELRRLCQARDDARRERDLRKAEADARARQAELAADEAGSLRPDAVRYRRLRNDPWAGSVRPFGVVSATDEEQWVDGRELDGLVDRALAQEAADVPS